MRPLVLAALVVFTALSHAAAARAEPLTKVFINGSATPVYFNDGDSFRIHAGPFKGTQSRLSGYNTLESFGPVHTWGSWTEAEMYAIAKMATHEAQQGVWNCEGDGKKDGYGRLLLFCKDLAIQLIGLGLAHTYSVNQEPGDPDLLKVQREAMAAKRGLWAHGIPRFIVTSLHAKSEGGDKEGVTSNRLISTTDAHSEKWVHNDDYQECQKVCSEVDMMTDADAGQNAEQLGALPEAAAALGAIAEGDRSAALRAVYERLARGQPAEEAHAPLLEGMRKLKSEGKLVVTGKQTDSCHVYVDFRRRFGGERAKCLH
ncbi:MAG: hypothetical protein A2138_03500 [Deltaproteobacteria bacterium RBG_16_71_12]|nr:MAG: hypothetical protein A2138_03500 [Deltaproteobacteria bacterium RBG_16_71_12]